MQDKFLGCRCRRQRKSCVLCRLCWQFVKVNDVVAWIKKITMITIVNTSLHTILLVELYFDVINSDFIKSMARSTFLIKSRAKEHTLNLFPTKI